ncbi:protein FORGETTER 1-like [Bidens hawaiensis]|uniref:protein FORGETTER 1-like n=1 Tax=Bidens hawaiensis TaxID=980011 RepID=UPI004049647E
MDHNHTHTLHKQEEDHPPPPEEVNEVAIEVEREEDGGGVVGETFTDYRPLKMSIGPPHPDPIVETSSLSAVQPPEPTYDLKTKDYFETSNILSCLQIETLVYACQRHLHHLDNGTRAGFFIGDGAGVGKGRSVAALIWENWQHGRRKALWISVGSDLKFDARRDLDDVGATCIEVHALNKLKYSKLDSKTVGIYEGVIFLTYSSLIASSDTGRSRLKQLVQWCGLKFDGLIVFDECHKAKNLVPETGGRPTQTGAAVVELQEQLPEARAVYCSATGASEPRNLGYMVRLGLWGVGTSFENFRDFLVALEKGGVGALELVAMEMKARGMYLCRTLSYKGSEFEVVEVPLEAKMTEIYSKSAEFWTELRTELLSASELTSLDKRSLSQLWRLYWGSHQRFFRYLCMSAKVPAVVSLSKQALMENKCVVIGLQTTGEARTEDAISKYGTELDDFISGPRELLLKFVEENYPLPEKIASPPPVEDNVKEVKRKRHSANSDASIKGRLRKAAKRESASEDDSSDESDWEIPSNDEIDEDSDNDSGYEQESDAESADHHQTRHPFVAELQKIYESALERKSRLLDKIRSFDLPNNPLDELVDQLGGPDNVAEITGRQGMLVRAPNGKGVTYQARNTKDVSMEMVNMHEKQLFMGGKKLVAIISEAGSAGVSLQADRRALNQKRRVHVTLELPWSADRAIQQFGRTHRSNQASAPQYRLLFTNLGGELRFASVVAKRLASLGALTQGDRRAGPSLSAYNYDSLYGKRALFIMYKGILEKASFPVVLPDCSSGNPDTIEDFIEKAKTALASIGIIKVAGHNKDSGKLYGRIVDSDMHDVARFLNRLLGLPPDIQNRLFELFVSILDHLVSKARDEGHIDNGIFDLKGNSVELQGTPKTVYTDHMSGASTVLYTFIVGRGITWEAASALLNEKQEGGPGSFANGFYESQREWLGRRHFLLAIQSSSGTFKIYRPATGETLREMPIIELKAKYSKMTSLEKAQRGWKADYETSTKLCMHGPNCKLGRFCTVGRSSQEVNVLGGLILPIWGAIQKALSKQVRPSYKRTRVARVETTDNEKIVGLLVPNAEVGSVLKDLACAQDMDE